MTCCPVRSTVFASNRLSRSRADPDRDFAMAPVTSPISPPPAIRTPTTDDASLASKTVEHAPRSLG